jgi:hypothetical protein
MEATHIVQFNNCSISVPPCEFFIGCKIHENTETAVLLFDSKYKYFLPCWDNIENIPDNKLIVYLPEMLLFGVKNNYFDCTIQEFNQAFNILQEEEYEPMAEHDQDKIIKDLLKCEPIFTVYKI